MQHKKPCGECPFRRKSLPGYLGANDVSDFSSMAMSEQHMPCHSLVDYEDDNWQTEQEQVEGCAGRSIMWRNQCKLPHPNSPVPLLEPDKETVFSNIREFTQHHTKKYPLD